jgi:hypothetical protein
LQLYKAVIWLHEWDASGRLVSVFAETLKQAEERLTEQYGEGNVFSLHVDEDRLPSVQE